MTLDKEKQYAEVYFPEKMVPDKDEAYSSLVDIDSNFSKFLQSMIKQISILAKVIDSYGKNFRHFEWMLVIKDKQTGKTFSTEELPRRYRKVSEDDV